MLSYANAKTKRERLFKKSRPVVRRLEIMDGDQYTKDLGVIWAAYKAGSFPIALDLSQEDFVAVIEGEFSKFQQMWIVDDESKLFSGGRGQIALIGTNSFGLVVEPRASFFKWASPRAVLRASVAFLQMIRNSKKTGICMVKTDKKTLPLHLKDYDVLHFMGRCDANEYLFSVRGRGGALEG
jgi:hypothetical protein